MNGSVSSGNGITPTAAPLPLPRILIVDHFDSYTLNLLSLLSQIASSDAELASKVVVLPHTHELLSDHAAFEQHLLPHFDAVILSPGPGSPHVEADFGFGLHFLRRASVYNVPTLGVCLGHQGLAVAFGGTVKRARSIQHGITSRLEYASADAQSHPRGIFHGVPSHTPVTRYNSLTVDVDDLPDCLEVVATSSDDPPTSRATHTSDLIKSRATSPHVVASRQCIQALVHKTLPLWGVQFHPESIESQGGVQLMTNFIRQVWAHHRQQASTSASTPTSSSTHIPPSIRQEAQRYVAGIVQDGCVSDAQPPRFLAVTTHTLDDEITPSRLAGREEEAFTRLFRSHDTRGSSIWLDSARRGDPQSQRSYMARPTFGLSYARRHRRIDVHILAGPKQGTHAMIPLPSGSTFWDYMDALQKELQSVTDCGDARPDRARFRAGFVGYWGYEMKDESLGLQADETISRGEKHDDAALPEAMFLFCNAVLQLDHVEDRCSVVMLQGGAVPSQHTPPLLSQLVDVLSDHGIQVAQPPPHWLADVTTTLVSIVASPAPKSATHRRHHLPPLSPLDSAQDYQSKVEAARALIAQGESYELCLTTQFVGQRDRDQDSFDLYRTLRTKNPAPYGAYIELPAREGRGDGTRSILSSSPERFLSKTCTGSVEMKPIKGTLPRAGYGSGDAEHIARYGEEWKSHEDARRRQALRADPKERAENLMIVDLIRADLLSFCQPSSVVVPTLMRVESYESVHQLVTTVCGEAKPWTGSVEAVRRCFPPGSMTGAPKRRSVTLLERLEGKSRSGSETEWTLAHRPRGVYSGCLGYLSIDGAADFSVVIRTAVVDEQGQVSVGAGGAITYLSEAAREWEEVLHKVRALGVGVGVGQKCMQTTSRSVSSQ